MADNKESKQTGNLGGAGKPDVEPLSDQDLESVSGGDSVNATSCCSVNATACCHVNPDQPALA